MPVARRNRTEISHALLNILGHASGYRYTMNMDFTGTYDVVSSPDFAGEHLRPGYVVLRQRGKFVKGEYEIGTMCGTLNGGVNTDFIDFDFAGNDEMEDDFGEGEATLDGDRLTFELRNYRGDEFVFECLRRE